MAGTLEDYAASIRNLIGICRDAEQGFRAAADAAKDPILKDLFEQYSQQRAGFASDLQNTVKAMGFEVSHPSGLGGIVHGAWIAVKGAVTGHSDAAILEETERGEDWSLKTYREAMAVTLPPELGAVIEQQYQQVLAAHDHIRTLRNARRAASGSPPANGPVEDVVAPPAETPVAERTPASERLAD